MKKILLAAIAMGLVLPAAAQDTYESARLLGSDLNGTARYVGMGGAMEALGADISTMGTNPAGIGLFRHSTASLSFGVVSQADAKEFDGLNKTNMSFDQAGFVSRLALVPPLLLMWASTTTRVRTSTRFCRLPTHCAVAHRTDSPTKRPLADFMSSTRTSKAK